MLEKNIKYRPDIDGLRALAVLSVVFYHAFPEYLTGGFAGVDIFFVISGFLITRIIYTELDNNSFSFIKFFSRRIRRIFPALILVLTFCLILGWFVLLSQEYEQLGKHIAGSAGFIQNFILYQESGYFDVAAETKPLLHIWSLGIEEQFYIIWPLFLWIAWKNKFNLLTLTLLLFSLSFFWNLYYRHTTPVEVFFWPISRFWELLGGSLLAWSTLYKKEFFSRIGEKLEFLLKTILYEKKHVNTFLILPNISSFLGVLLLSISFFKFNKSISYPGVWALGPVLGAILIIYSGKEAWFNRVILSNRITVWIGLISYPLYLWHWPILSFLRVMDGEIPHRDARIGAIFFSILLAWLTYKFIEKPIRFCTFKKRIVFILCVLIFSIGYIGYFVFKNNGIESRYFVQLNLALNNDLLIPSGRRSDGSCDQNNFQYIKATDNWNVCSTNSKAPKVMFIGDSHAMALYSSLMQNNPKKTLLFARHGCAPLNDVKQYSNGHLAKKCENYKKDIFIMLDQIKSVDLVIIASRGPYYYSKSDFPNKQSNKTLLNPNATITEAKLAFESGINNIVKHLIKMNKRVILMVDNPEFPVNTSTCLRKGIKGLSQCNYDKSSYLLRTKSYRDILNHVASQYQNTYVYNPEKVFCDNKKCYGYKHQMMMYFDDDHMSVRASKLVIDDMYKYLDTLK